MVRRSPRVRTENAHIFDIVEGGKVTRIGYCGQGAVTARWALVSPTVVPGLRVPEAQAPALVDRLDA
jgi:hypothetical protein